VAPLEFWFEFASTYSYPAAMRVGAAAERAGVPLVWKPFLLGPIFAAQGWNDSPFNVYPVKGRYMWRDLERICADQGVPLRRPSRFPRNGLLAARVALLGADQPWQPDFVRAVYHANFAEDREIADAAELAALLERLGLDAGTVLERAQSPDTKDRLRRQTEQARERGIFGAPSFVSRGELFWGNDRLETALAWHRSHG
jgi:2-hydroxychromene-2-carboxylate isomerase